jgi:hypothetical protein
VLSSGIFTFAEPDNPDFAVLDIGNLVESMIDASDSELAGNLYNGVRNFFPYPVARTTIGYRFPIGVEAMLDIGGFPQFIANIVNNNVDAVDSLRLSTLHIGSLVRMAILNDAGPFPALSIGAGYTYQGVTVGYDLTSPDPITVDAGDLYLSGEMLIRNSIHAFGLDLRVSKALGVFVPFLALSPYFHIAQFAGNIGDEETFEAFIDINSDGEADSTYFGTHPDTAYRDYDLSLVLSGGFELVFEKVAIEFHGSWNVAKGSPGVALGMRWQ